MYHANRRMNMRIVKSLMILQGTFIASILGLIVDTTRGRPWERGIMLGGFILLLADAMGVSVDYLAYVLHVRPFLSFTRRTTVCERFHTSS